MVDADEWPSREEESTNASRGVAGRGVLGIDRGGWISTAAGIALAGIIVAVPPFQQALWYLSVLIHELGHTIAGWLFGYPSIPALDFQYGGGVTIHTDRSVIIMVMVSVMCGSLLLWWARGNPVRLAIFAAGAALYTWFALTYLHEVAILFMGHGTELVFSGIFLYRSLSGSAVLHPLERPLYAAIGGFILFDSLRFSCNLITNDVARLEYESAKGGGHIMDFSRIAEDYFRADLSSVALFFVACCVLTPVAVLVYLRLRPTEEK